MEQIVFFGTIALLIVLFLITKNNNKREEIEKKIPENNKDLLSKESNNDAQSNKKKEEHIQNENYTDYSVDIDNDHQKKILNIFSPLLFIFFTYMPVFYTNFYTIFYKIYKWKNLCLFGSYGNMSGAMTDAIMVGVLADFISILLALFYIRFPKKNTLWIFAGITIIGLIPIALDKYWDFILYWLFLIRLGFSTNFISIISTKIKKKPNFGTLLVGFLILHLFLFIVSFIINPGVLWYTHPGHSPINFALMGIITTIIGGLFLIPFQNNNVK